MSGRLPIEVRRGHWWEAPALGVNSARAYENDARRPDGRFPRPPRFQRMPAVMPPPPLRFYVLVLLHVGNLLVFPYWIGRTADDVAVTILKVLGGRGRHRDRARVVAASGLLLLVLVVLFTAVLLPAGFAFGPAGIVAATALFFGALAPIGWHAVRVAKASVGRAQLRDAEGDLISSAAGPVWLAGDLAGGGNGAGSALVRVLLDRADAEGTTVIAHTERGVLLDFYEKRGFTVEAEREAAWGTEVLVTYRPGARRDRP